MDFKKRAALFLLLISVSFFLFFSIYNEVKRRTIKQLYEQQTILITQAAIAIKNFFTTYRNELQFLSRSPNIIHLNLFGKKRLQSYFGAHKTKLKGLSRVSKDGTINFSTYKNRIASKKKVSDQPHNKFIMQQHKPVVSDLINLVQGGLAIVYAHPVFKGKYYNGCLSAIVSMRFINKKFLKHLKVGKNGYAFLIDKNGRILYHPRKEFIMRSVVKLAKGFPRLQIIVNKMIKGREGEGIYRFYRARNQPAVKKHVTFRNIKLANNHWSLAVCTPEDELLQIITGFRNRLLLFLATSILFLIGFGYYSMQAKQAKQFKQLNEELELKVEKRTVDLANALKKQQETTGKLQKSEAHFHTLFEDVPVGILITSFEGAILTFNKRVPAIFGYTAEEFKNITALDLYKNISDRKAILNKIKKEGCIHNYEAEYTKHNGETIYVSINISPIELDHKTALLSAIEDYTERKKSEEKIYNLKQQIEFILGATKTGLNIIDSNFNIVYIDPEWGKIYGNPTNKKCYEYFMCGSAVCNICSVAKALETKKIASNEMYLIKENNRPILTTSIPFQNEKGEWLVASVNTDISELKKTENNLRLEMLQRKHAEEQLKELVEELEKSNDDLEDFAYIVSHDLKAPLRAIGSLASWLAEDYGNVLDEKGFEYINKMKSRTKRLHSFIEGILQYSRAGRAKIETEIIDTEALVSEIIENITPTENISFKIAPTLPTVIYDKTLLSQIFQNLLSNAIKHIEKPQGEISVSCQDKNSEWEFCVSDNGIGIEQKHFERIFKIFQTLKPRDQVESTGIGLSLVKRIVERNNGIVRIESEYGKGAAFYFTIPKKKLSCPFSPYKNILLVDCNIEFSQAAEKIFKKLDYTVSLSTDCPTAYELLSDTDNVIDIIILDHNIPGSDTQSFVSIVRKIRPQIKIVISTDNPKEQSIQRIKHVDAVLEKPFKTERVRDFISKLLTKKPGGIQI